MSSSDCGERAGRTRARRGMFGAVPCRVDLRSRSASLDAAQEAVTAGAAHRHRSVLKRRSCRHRGGDRARRAHDKTCVRDGGELGRGWWAENASRYGRAGPRRAPRRNRALRTNRRNRWTDSRSPNTTRGPPPPVSQSENSDCIGLPCRLSADRRASQKSPKVAACRNHPPAVPAVPQLAHISLLTHL